jgi:hypothetical protein
MNKVTEELFKLPGIRERIAFAHARIAIDNEISPSGFAEDLGELTACGQELIEIAAKLRELGSVLE